MRTLPSGTVTFLFTDVEGSTRLLQEHGDAYAGMLGEHRRVLREAFAAHGGVEVDTQGDAFFVAFARASDALAAAEEGQRALAGGSVRVRMGVHTGEPTVTEEGYVGMDVHRAARIAASGHGGQVLVSQSTRELGGVDGLRDLGEHRLKDLSAPERIYQLGDVEFPPLKTLYATNLPVPVTPFVGRDRELGEVQELLVRDDVRLLTLTGAGGSGKTRLALHSAAAAAEEFPHGVWWVPLAAVTDAAEVVPAAARALGGGAPLPELVADRRLLLVLDNFEHVVDAAPEVGALLTACPRLDVLVTSRERLRVHGEQAYSVPVLSRADARDLFVGRARAASANFEPDDDVDELCARLDDLPLALELAAARTSLLSTKQLLERLGSRLDLLRGGRDSEVRQRTLRATIEWSYELLDPDEQRLLAALSVFRGGWTLDAAERVCDADIELLHSLVDKSLVRRWGLDRFGMLETIREFAAERLDAQERDELLRRLLDHLTAAFAGAYLHPETFGLPQTALAQAERPNFDVALQWAIDAGAAEEGLGLLWMCELYWVTNDPVGAGERVDALLAAAGDELDPAVHARALRLRGATFGMTGKDELSEQEYQRAQELFRSAGDDRGASELDHRIANSAVKSGDLERGARLAREALERDRERGDRYGQALALGIVAEVAFAEGKVAEATALSYEAAEVAKEIGFVWWQGITLVQAAQWLLEAGQQAEAVRAFASGVPSLVAASDQVNLPIAVAVAAALAAGRSDVEAAGTLWGAIEAFSERDAKPLTMQGIREYAPYVEPVRGTEFDGAAARGRTLSLDEAVEYALANLD